MRHLNKMFILFFTALAPLAFALACDSQANQPPPQRPAAPVTVFSAITGDVPVYLDEIGKSVAREVVSVQPQVSGRITEIHFTDGADVQKGALLFTIDPRPYKAAFDSANATLAQNIAALNLSQIELKRIKSVVDPRAVSQQDYDLRKNTVSVAQARVKQSEAAVDTARLNLEYCYVRSPIEGRTGQRLVDLGNVVTANVGSLLVIQKLDPIYADFTVTEKNLTAVQENMRQGTLKVEVGLPDSHEKSREGTLTFVDNAVQETTGTVKLRATIPNADRYFWPGRFVHVRLVLSTLQTAVMVPANAPQMSAQGPFVYVVKPDATAELRQVKLGQPQGDKIVIAEGLAANERVVINGQLGVTPGGKVRIAEATDKTPKAAHP